MELLPIQNLLKSQIALRQNDIISATQLLVAAGSPNPPGDTTRVAEAATHLLTKIPEIEIIQHETAPGIVNLVARISSGRPGQRLVFNGHLDTYPICEHLNWTVPPLDGILKDEKIYGRGASDMKGGIAASIVTATVLAEHKHLWSGEIVITLAGDEESMGPLGTGWLLENVDIAKGDFMICGDVGSPNIIRFGEKGFCWFEITATGISAHGAHVHKGINAIDRLRKALNSVDLLENLVVQAPPEIEEAIEEATKVSETTCGHGESHTLQHVTVNIGTITGGTLLNLMPSQASAQGDIRLPIGISVSQVLEHLHQHLDTMAGVTWRIIRSHEPTYTAPAHPLVQSALLASRQILGKDSSSMVNMRVGASDSRLYRATGVPSVVLGCTGYGLGAADEYATIGELVNMAQIHALIAYDLLKPQ
ncbi:acetylornithine deacetylase [Mollisia scopiformis]|uniref:Acetylornithine deacetylase n=1 Tax=Mollisia scopiformis TaxID=149040 RepID=A0A194WXZ7_MOLSC|nr:acetylornithine deacetylase [Mollisia scopiformis]KUJ12848.1 acetylornithine deacetylase [Mollisia scopiformis]